MGWYQGGSAASPELYTTRIDLTGPSSGAGTIDGQWVIGPEDTKFWAAIVAAGDSSGHRIVFTAPDGVTEYAWKRTAWSYANRTATLEIDAISLATTSAAIHVIYCYCGNEDSGDLATTPTISAAVTFRATGILPLEVITLAPAKPGQTAPTVRLQKTTTEQRTVWVDVRRQLAAATEAFNAQAYWEEIAYVVLNVLSSGSDQAAMYDNGKIRVLGGLVRLYLKAGSDGTTYTISLQVATATPKEPANATSAPARILDLRALLIVEDVDES